MNENVQEIYQIQGRARNNIKKNANNTIKKNIQKFNTKILDKSKNYIN